MLFRLLLLVVTLLSITIRAVPALAQDVVANPAECVTDYDPEVDYFPAKVEPEYTQGFTIEYFNNYKVVTVNTPWPNAEAEDAQSYVLMQCGTPAPDGYDEATFIDVPVTSFATMSTTYLPYVEAYGLLDALVGVDTLSSVSAAGVVAKGDDLVQLVNANFELDLEAAIELAPQMIMTYGFGFDTDTYLQLQEAGLTTVLNGEFAETTPLARAEWGKFLALFFNKEAEAASAFEDVAAEYNELAAMAAATGERPTVFLNSPFQGTWYMAGGGSYMAQFMEDAGANYLWAEDESTGSLTLDFEAVFEIAADADFWLNGNQFWMSQADMVAEDARYADFAAFQNDNVWSNNLAVNENFGNDFYESGVAYPNLVLADLVAIFHPELLPDHTFTYYRHITE